MVTVAKAIKLIVSELDASLSAEGFRKVRPYLLACERPESVVWQLSSYARKDRYSGQVFAGVSANLRFDRLQEYLQIEDLEPDYPTISTPLYLLHDDHQFVEWDIENPDTIPSIIRDVWMYALPYFRQYENLEHLLDSLMSNDPQQWLLGVSNIQRVELVAGILASSNRKAEALAWTSREIDALGNVPLAIRSKLESLQQKLGSA